MPPLTIIGSPPSAATQRVLVVARLLKLEYTLHRINYRSKEHKSEDFLATKNPFGLIPVLQDGDFTLYESRAICKYLIAKYQGDSSVQLLPSDVEGVAQVDQYMSVETCQFEPICDAFARETLLKKIRLGQSPDPEKVKQYRQDFTNLLTTYEHILNGKRYLCGEFMTLADVCHLPMGQYMSILEQRTCYYQRIGQMLRVGGDLSGKRKLGKKCGFLRRQRYDVL
ncbi:hypothetical protein BZG36_01539 [Bifiguratus adelaidae]|uniref:glutathione transferase n=1 Tax=Bifiguratus adelaidae TaxID=1938954 RepID=A0A261Y4G8_9FUNG|nr:hypothetical protein BZG36_01539 [Bifiguratus adelaidae]